MPLRRTLLLASVVAALPASRARAQSARSATRLLVGFPPGGTADVLARALAPKLARDGAPPVIVENKPGAGGRLAVTETIASPPDGRTVLVSADPILVIYPHVYRNIAYRTATDVLPLAPVASEPIALAIGPLVPGEVRSLAQFVAWCRQHPKDASYATAAAGTTMHFLGAMLARAEQLELQHVPHRGAAAALQDVMGGQIAATMTPLSQAVPQLGSGRLRLLAVSGGARSPRVPAVPTFAELGHKDIQAIVYYGTYLRAGTPPALVQQMHAAVSAAAQSAEVVATLDKLALDPMASPQERFAAQVRGDLERWGPIVKATGYSVDD